MFYDIRLELGNNGLTPPTGFVREGIQYTASIFTEDLTALDIWPTVDITPPLAPYESLASTFTAAFNVDHYDIIFDVNSVSLEDAKSSKYDEIWQHASNLNAAAEAQFIENNNNNPVRTNDRLAKKWQKISNKKVKGSSLSAKEEEFDDSYDSMLDYQDAVNDAADQGADDVELMQIDDVYAYDAVNDPIWPPEWSLEP